MLRIPFICFALFPFLTGCYPIHATLGHLDLMSKRQPVSDLIEDNAAPINLKTHLQRVAEIREFASRELGLPNNGSYRNYAALDRDYPVWNVWATPEFDLQPRTSCFPVVGCVPYRGYYSKELALEYANEFREAGDDVTVGGVTAYSTLGFFDDPITSTMLRLPEEKLAGLIFHELAHQVVYVKSNTTFNESFARAVEIEGTLQWLKNSSDEGALSRYRASLARADAFFSAVKDTRAQLGELYASERPDSEKRRLKQEILESMRKAHHERKINDPVWSSYDPWFDGDINNAKLSAVATYFDDVSMFREMLRNVGGDFTAFYSAVQAKARQLEDSARQHA